jgi:hypothetical protein
MLRLSIPADGEYDRREALVQRLAEVWCRMDGLDPDASHASRFGSHIANILNYRIRARKHLAATDWKDPLDS